MSAMFLTKMTDMQLRPEEFVQEYIYVGFINEYFNLSKLCLSFSSCSLFNIKYILLNNMYSLKYIYMFLINVYLCSTHH